MLSTFKCGIMSSLNRLVPSIGSQCNVQMRLRFLLSWTRSRLSKNQLRVQLPTLWDIVLILNIRRNTWLVVLQVTSKPLSSQRRPYNKLQHSRCMLIDLRVFFEKRMERWWEKSDGAWVIKEQYRPIRRAEYADPWYEEAVEFCWSSFWHDFCGVVP